MIRQRGRFVKDGRWGVVLVCLVLAAFVAACGAPAGKVRGRLVGRDSGRELKGAYVVLCPLTAEKQCYLDDDIATLTDGRGRFEFSKVSPGVYVVVYDPTRQARFGNRPWKGRTIDFSTVQSLSKSLGAEPRIKRETVIVKDEGRASIVEGAMLSKDVPLVIEIRGGNPITIEVQAGQTVEIEIEGWGL